MQNSQPCECQICNGLVSRCRQIQHLQKYGHMHSHIRSSDMVENIPIVSEPVLRPIEKKIVHVKTNNNQIYDFIMDIMKIYVYNNCTETVITSFLSLLKKCPFIDRKISVQFPATFKHA